MLKIFKKNKKCNHNPNSEKTTLKKNSKVCMVYPSKNEYMCTICHKFFTFED